MKNLKFIGAAVLFVVITFFVVFETERIDSGNTGILVNLAGSERGVDDAKVETGWVIYNRWTKQLFEYPAYAQLVDYEKFDIKDKNGTIFYVDPTIEYSILRDDAKKVFLSYRLDYGVLSKSVVLNEVKNAYKNIAGTYDTDSLINNTPQFEKEVEAELSKQLNVRGFTLTNIQSSVKPNTDLQDAINAKTIATQRAIQAENERKIAEANAAKAVAEAKGKAEANKLLETSITPELLQLKAIEKWNGALPQVTSSATPFINLK